VCITHYLARERAERRHVWAAGETPPDETSSCICCITSTRIVSKPQGEVTAETVNACPLQVDTVEGAISALQCYIGMNLR
jgi:hypothetical protein